jgi:hypothetical protein
MPAAEAAAHQRQDLADHRRSRSPITRRSGRTSTRRREIAGPAGAVAEELTGVVKMGFTAPSFTPDGPGAAEQAERLAREVIPAVRAAV